jgi:hypothetical protein
MRMEDAVMIVTEGQCGVSGSVPSPYFVSVGKLNAGEEVVEVQAGSISVNAPVNTRYDVCWCPWEGGCSGVQAFGTVVGKITIDVKVDCEVSEWFVDVVCSKTCGSGVETVKRIVRVAPQGGGVACPAVMSMTQPCNTQACPQAQINSVTLLPESPASGQAFQAVIEGWNLEPDVDRVLLISNSRSCGGAATVDNLGGAACWYGTGDSTKITCGDGSYSMKVDEDANVRMCLCDASFIFDSSVVTNRADACSQVSHYTRELLVFVVGTGAGSPTKSPVALIGGIIGAVLVAAVVASIVWVKLKRGRKASKQGNGEKTPDPYSEAVVLHVPRTAALLTPDLAGPKEITFPAEYTLEEAEEGSPDPSEPDFWQPETHHHEHANEQYSPMYGQQQNQQQLTMSPYLQSTFGQAALGYGPVDDGPMWQPDSPRSDEISDADEMLQPHQPATPRFVDETPPVGRKTRDSLTIPSAPEPKKPSFLSRVFGSGNKSKISNKVQPMSASDAERLIQPPQLGDSPASPLTNRSDLSMTSPNIGPAPAKKGESAIPNISTASAITKPEPLPTLNVIHEEPARPQTPPEEIARRSTIFVEPPRNRKASGADDPQLQVEVVQNEKDFEPVNFDLWKSAAAADEDNISPSTPHLVREESMDPPLSPTNAAEKRDEPITVAFPPRLTKPLDSLAQELTEDQPKSGNSTPRVSLAASARRNRLLNMK